MISLPHSLKALCFAGAMLMGLAGNAHAQFSSLGAPANETLVGEPSCLTWPTTNTWVACFVRGASGGMWRIGSMDGVTFESGWQPVGGALFSDPVCVSPTWPQVQCFATFRDQALWRRTSGDAGRTWNDWQEVRADIRGRPSCLSPSPTIVDCFGIASDLNAYRIRVSGTSTTVTPIGVLGAGAGGNFTFSLGPGFVAPFVMPGPECVLRRDANGATLNTLCFARKTNGSMWTTTLNTNPAADPLAQWTRVTGLSPPPSALQCFDRPGGRIDCFGTSGSAGRHFSNVQLAPGTTASGGFFFESLNTQGHIAPVRCFTAPGAPNIECLIVSWPAQSLPASPPFDLWRFTHDGNSNVWSSQNLGPDVRGAPSCVHWAYRPTPVTLAVGDIQCFVVGGTGDLVYRRLNPPLEVEILRPPVGEIRRCRPGSPGCG